MWLGFLVKVMWRIICSHRNYHIACVLIRVRGRFMHGNGDWNGFKRNV